jgi:predicted AlkP superfamily phosphohydrolase/phosphomutase
MGFRSLSRTRGKLQIKIVSSSSTSAKRIWETLSEKNRRICLLNLPLTYPPFPINGILVSGFPVPYRDCIFTYPPDLQDELFRIAPDFQATCAEDGAAFIAMKKIDEAVDCWTKRLFGKTRLALGLLKRESWDVFMVHYQETDFLQHRLWHCLDKTLPYHDPDGFLKVSRFYRELDSQLSEVISEARRQGFATIIVSDHGFQACDFRFMANSWLYQKGYLVLNRNFRGNVVALAKKIFSLPFAFKLRSRIQRRRAAENIRDTFFEAVINYEKSILFMETNATNIAFAHFLTKDQRLIERTLKEFDSLVSPAGSKLLTEIKRMVGEDGVYKMTFADGITASGTVPDKKPFFEVPKPFEQWHIGVHHRDGIIILDDSLSAYNLPKRIHEVAPLIMKVQGIAFAQGRDTFASRESLSNGEVSSIESQLRSLGYL